MTYEEALREANKIGVSKVEGLLLLAITVETLAMAHAISPKLAYQGAVKMRFTASQVRKLDAIGLSDLMFA